MITKSVYNGRYHVPAEYYGWYWPFFILEGRLEGALSVQKDNASTPFLYLRRIIRLDELDKAFVVRLVMRLQYKDEHKTL